MAKSKDPKISKKSKEKSALCEHCGKNFSKPANLKTHVEKVHKGLRWRCPICHEEQVSKFSHERHYKSNHPEAAPLNSDANMRYAGVYDYLPEKAKDSAIENLKERNKVLEALVKNFRKRLLKKMKENMELKARLELDIEAEKSEYNLLVGPDDTDSENSDDSNGDLAQCVAFDGENEEDDDNNEADDALKHITESEPGAGPSTQ